MKIEHEQNHSSGRFFSEENGDEIGEMTYTRAGSVVTINHTKVQAGAQGRGLGKQLVLAGIEWARREHLKINPVCPFARTVFERTTEYEDVRAH